MTAARTPAAGDHPVSYTHLTLPWHVVGMMGQPRRMAYYDFSDPALAPQAIWVSISVVGGAILVFSTLLLLLGLLGSHRGLVSAQPPLRFSLALRPPSRLPASLNGFGVWIVLVAALTVVNYGFPIAQILTLQRSGVATSPVETR